MENPRDWYTIGNMVCLHSKYNLGDKHPYRKGDFNSWDEIKKQIVKDNGPCIILPIYMYDHSSITLSTSPFSCRWDSGQVGFIFVTNDEVKLRYGYNTITKNIKENIERVLTEEVNMYDKYINGDTYMYIVENEEGVEISRCSGFFDYDDCESAAKAFVNSLIK